MNYKIKTFIINHFLLLFFNFSLLHDSTIAQSKHAFIIGISNYQKGIGWNPLHSENDIEIISDALRKRGFKNENIYIYSGEITKQMIMKALDFDIYNKINEGDIVFFHFSGHGQQIADDNGDEMDGLDESLVPYNAPSRNSMITSGNITIPYNRDRHIRDDELGKALTNIRKKLGTHGNLFVSIDACHSASSYRGGELDATLLQNERGSDIPNIPEGWKYPENLHTDNQFELESKNAQLAPMVCVYGSRPQQKNKECQVGAKWYGSLSYALSQAINNANENTSYTLLFEEIKRIMAIKVPGQSPVLEGQDNQVIFGGKLLPKPFYFNITKISKDTIFINGGVINNILEGTIIGFYPPDTRTIENISPIFTAKVVNAGLLESYLVLNDRKDLTIQEKKAWVFVLERNFGKMNINIDFKDVSFEEKKIFLNKIKEFPFIKVSNENIDLLIEKKNNSIIYTHRTGIEILNKEINFNDRNDLEYLVSRIVECAQNQFIRNIHSESNTYNLDFSLILQEQINKPATENNRIFKDDLNIDLNTPNVNIKEGSVVKYQIKNNSNVDLYLNLIELVPTMQFSESSFLMPNSKNPNPEDYIVRANSIFALSYDIGPPYGTNPLVLIASEEPLNLKSIARTRGKGNLRSNIIDIENLFQETFMNEPLTRSGNTRSIKGNNYSIITKVFNIIP